VYCAEWQPIRNIKDVMNNPIIDRERFMCYSNLALIEVSNFS